MKRPTRCAVIGQAPLRFPWGFDEEDPYCSKMKLALAQQIMGLQQYGVTQFLVACDCGVGLYAAEIINGLHGLIDDLSLLCFTPYEEQATKWAPYLRERYFKMLEKCTQVVAVSPRRRPFAQLKAYQKIIDLADMVLFVYDLDSSVTASAEDRALAYAVDTAHKPVFVLHPTRLTTNLIDLHFNAL